MTSLLRVLSGVSLFAIACTQAGCLLVAAAAGTGATVAYVKGDLDSTVDASPQQIADATRAAMAGLEMHVISGESSSVDAKVVGRTATDRKLTVVAKALTAKSSKISVRAGTFGNDALQARLLEAIREQIETTAKTPSTLPAMMAGEPH